MKWFKFVIGLFAILLGVIGFGACLAGIGGVWLTRARVDQTVITIFDRVDHVLNRIETRAEQASTSIQEMRDVSVELNARVQQRAAGLQDIPTEEAPNIGWFGREIHARIQLGRSWLEFMDDTVVSSSPSS